MFNKLDWIFNLGLLACGVYLSVVLGNALYHFAVLFFKII
jgi:hypothetical protein